MHGNYSVDHGSAGALARNPQQNRELQVCNIGVHHGSAGALARNPRRAGRGRPRSRGKLLYYKPVILSFAGDCGRGRPRSRGELSSYPQAGSLLNDVFLTAVSFLIQKKMPNFA